MVTMRLLVPFVVLLYPPLCPTFKLLSPQLIRGVLKSQISSHVDRIIENPKCASDVKLWVSSLLRGELWAISMLDASSKPNSGILSANVYHFGSYEQCLSINEYLKGDVIKAQYCNVFIQPLTNSSFDMLKLIGMDRVPPIAAELLFVVDVCVPHSCTSRDLNLLWDSIAEPFEPKFRFTFKDHFCHHKDKPVRPTAIDTFSFLFFGGILVTVLASTAYDIYLHHTKSKKNLFIIFSLYTNTKKLLSTQCENSTLTCVYGLRFFCMLWIFVSHFILVKIVLSNSNSFEISEWKNYFKNCIFISGQYAVETYFCIGGLLISYVQLKYSDKFKINLLGFYFHRILRLVPALLATILLYLSVVKHVFEGPAWLLLMEKIVGNCSRQWWTTVLFVSNFLPFRHQCIEQSWYLSVDTHLYLLAPLILFQIKKRPSRVILAVLATCLLCMIYSFVVVLVQKLTAVLLVDTGDRYLHYIYLSPINHAPAWLFGILTGYLLYRHGSTKIQIPKKTNLILWSTSFFVMTLLLLSQTVATRNSHNYFFSAVLNSLARPLWSLAVCFMIFSCSTGHGGFINTFLSHPVLIVLGKLTYSMYLTHLVVIAALTTGSLRQPGYFSGFDLLVDFWGIFIVTLASSAVMCLVFETPVLALFKGLEKKYDPVLKKE